MSGRLDHFFVTEAVLDVMHYQQLVASASCGAVASFIGTVRSPNKGQVVQHIDYEGYEGMILAQMRVVVNELRDRYDLGGLVIGHRLGRLLPGEASIAIVVASRHRKDALEACHACIDRCKELLPVWKREVTKSGEVWVEGSSVASEVL
jgi:molybdopterin synthase catalytic subunit